MRICFYGASQMVTGSSYLVETEDFKLLVDCGMFQGSKITRELNYGEFPFDPKSLDAVIITHAHIDHSGLVPKLIKQGYNGPIYATPATIEFCSILLPDSGHIQEMEIERKNRKRLRADLPPLQPIYVAEDGLKAIEYFKPLKYGESLQLSKTITIELSDAGHILGSSQATLSITENEKTKKLVFSGDLGTANQPYIQDPSEVKQADIIIMETTYGNRLHEDKSNRLEIFAEIINKAHAKGGNIIIPAFAVERTQDILYYIQKLQRANMIPILPVYIDSPLAVSATRIFRKNMQNFDEETLSLINEGNNPLTMDNLNFSETTQDSMQLNTITGGAIIISASGMADAGRIKHHLKHNLWRSNATVIFVGYQAQGTLGRMLVEGAKEVTIHGEKVVVSAEIAMLPGFSGHADQGELLNWLKTAGVNAEHIILAHGEEESMREFSIVMETSIGKTPIIPVLGECIDFQDHEINRIPPEKPWIETMQEKFAERQSEIEREKPNKKMESKIFSKKYTRQRRILLSEVNHSYTKVKKQLALFVNGAKKGKDYTLILETLDKISKMLRNLR